MRLWLNGAAWETRDGATLQELVREAGRDPARVAVALNGAVVPRGELATVKPAEGDRVEVIEPVGGG